MLSMRQRDRRALAYLQRYTPPHRYSRQPRDTLLHTRRIQCAREPRHPHPRTQHHHQQQRIDRECVLQLRRESGSGSNGRHRRDTYVRHRGTPAARDYFHQQHLVADPASTNRRSTAQHPPHQRIYGTKQGIGEITSIWYRWNNIILSSYSTARQLGVVGQLFFVLKY